MSPSLIFLPVKQRKENYQLKAPFHGLRQIFPLHPHLTSGGKKRKESKSLSNAVAAAPSLKRA